ncbi:MAG: hypothetical protein OJF51_000435 [Nitrospira sp.]|nr:MAG: hypothetical protein OJF51_000435 [Nitrospira sp.]
MGSFLPDISVMIAMVCTWHEYHGGPLRKWSADLRSGNPWSSPPLPW